MINTKIIRGRVKVLDAASGRIQAIVSTENPDRDCDVIRFRGWNFDNFNKHPVLLADHNYSDISSQMSHWESMETNRRYKVLWV